MTARTEAEWKLVHELRKIRKSFSQLRSVSVKMREMSQKEPDEKLFAMLIGSAPPIEQKAWELEAIYCALVKAFNLEEEMGDTF